MTEADRRIILSCFANGFEFCKDIEQNKLAEVKTLTGVETFTIEYMNKLAGILTEALDKQAAGDKYRWHDLRKNPEDLPDENWDVLLVVEEIETYGVNLDQTVRYTWLYCGYCIDDEWYTYMSHGMMSLEEANCIDERCVYKVIAWREIEPFVDDDIMPENADHRKQRGRTAPNEEER